MDMLGPSTAPSYALNIHVLPSGEIESNLRAALPSAAPVSVASNSWHLTPRGFQTQELTALLPCFSKNPRFARCIVQ